MGMRSAMTIDQKKRSGDVQDGILLKFALKYVKKYKYMLYFAVLLIVISSIIVLLPELLIKKILDEDIKNNDLNGLKFSVILMISLYILSWIISFCNNFVIGKLGQSTIYDVRNDMFEKLMLQSRSYFDKNQSGQINSRMTNDVEILAGFLGGSISSIISAVLQLIGIVAIMIYLDIALSLISFLIIPMLLLVTFVIRGPIRRISQSRRKTIANVTANIAENISGAKESKVFAREKENIQEFQQVNKENYEVSMKSVSLFALIQPAVSIIAAIGTMLILGYSGYQAAVLDNTKYTPGLVAAFMAYLVRFFFPIFTLSMFYNTWQAAVASLERVYIFLNEPIDIQNSTDAKEITIESGEITFQKVHFHYDESIPIFQDLNLEIKSGNMIAVVGPTGAGKTSLIKLIMRFYDITSGKLLIDGHDIQTYNIESLRSSIGMVPQEPILYNDSILENIRYGANGKTIEDVVKVAELVGIDEFVQTLPEGYHTMVSEGGRRLSMGQRQLIAFARAILPNPQLLILDEATSSLDPISEIRVQTALKRVLEGRTSIVIAHRLSTIRKADKIIVLENGKIIQVGTHKDLVVQSGKYQELYLKQYFTEKQQEEILAKIISK
ncbi:MAG: ABC transporter ATP-binding protein [Candidatus Kariarchaeaceae archaeon]|jgi:ATP-binding cassette subfamily B protein